MFAQLSMRTKLMVLVGVALAGLIVLGMVAMYSLKAAMLADRTDKVRNITEVAGGVIAYFEEQAANGKLSDAQAQKLAQEAFTKARYDGVEYVFVIAPDSTWLAYPRADLLGKKMREVVPSLYQLFEQRLQTAPNGVVIEYVWKKNDEVGEVGKVTYAAISQRWKWWYGTGIYVDDVQTAFLKSSLWMGIAIVILAVILLALSGVITSRLIRELGGEPGYAADVVRTIAAGDLRQNIQLRPNDHSSLLAAIADMQQRLRTLIREIVGNADSLGSMAGNIADHADRTAKSSEDQSSAATAMAASIEEMTVSINHIADHAEQARQSSAQAGDLAGQGASVLGQAVTEIQRINQAVEEASCTIVQLTDKTETISSIANVIHDIADQTNLLALNAAIEAARAGEQGRGFAVVADEVRKLAERTGTATQEISRMIADIHTSSTVSRENMEEAVVRVRAGVDLTEQGGSAVNRIHEGSSQVLHVVNDISHALREQSQASNDIAMNVERIAQVAAENAGIAHETAQATNQMHQMTDSLRKMVSRFQI
ncbi:methyl-accepting chemotaxis protein [Aquaspirillum soli]